MLRWRTARLYSGESLHRPTRGGGEGRRGKGRGGGEGRGGEERQVVLAEGQ